MVSGCFDGRERTTPLKFSCGTRACRGLLFAIGCLVACGGESTDFRQVPRRAGGSAGVTDPGGTGGGASGGAPAPGGAAGAAAMAAGQGGAPGGAGSGGRAANGGDDGRAGNGGSPEAGAGVGGGGVGGLAGGGSGGSATAGAGGAPSCVGGRACPDGLVCFLAGECRHCGELGEPCCGMSCNEGCCVPFVPGSGSNRMCIEVGETCPRGGGSCETDGSCSGCGQLGDACCTTADGRSWCLAAETTCIDQSTCESCGELDQPCCMRGDQSFPVPTCDAPLQCDFEFVDPTVGSRRFCRPAP